MKNILVVVVRRGVGGVVIEKYNFKNVIEIVVMIGVGESVIVVLVEKGLDRGVVLRVDGVVNIVDDLINVVVGIRVDGFEIVVLV